MPRERRVGSGCGSAARGLRDETRRRDETGRVARELPRWRRSFRRRGFWDSVCEHRDGGLTGKEENRADAAGSEQDEGEEKMRRKMFQRNAVSGGRTEKAWDASGNGDGMECDTRTNVGSGLQEGE